MSANIVSDRTRALAVAVACLLGLLITTQAGRRSEEHANRVYRSGAYTEAARLYGGRVRAAPTEVPLRYNFGTTLLALGSPSAAGELERAAAQADSSVRSRALYNLGRLHLLRARDSSSPDTVRRHAGLSVDANKRVLRLQPGHADARWNMALAQRMLDSLTADDGRAGTETLDGASDTDERVLSEELREFEDASEVSDAPREGSDETLAEGSESAPLSTLEATAILTSDGDRTVIVRKLLTYEGRARPRPSAGRTAPRW
jgi:hypothetical protein